MLFLRNEKFSDYIRLYPITSLILTVNIGLFIAMTLLGGSQNQETLLRFGALVNDPPFISEYWRYIASCFLHIGFDHLLFNMFSVLVFAPPLERLLGKAQYTLLYLGSGFLGNVASVLLSQKVLLSAGASGAIYGVYAAYIFLGLFRRQMLDPSSRKTIYIVVGIGVVYSIFMPQINYYGHLGGFVGGFILFCMMRLRIRG
ncbi:rhomboid family intramembrane serine protease [Paenibacillus thalictri]|uniref:Rhomboid family intramembrane serine protease n=1 Tax=Paenibacillus thalictri TaxID=2527873 RepID=A0A4Q9DYW3_9BACL|nr:rhomboid family intramembrane serine protease [Paenibacillus thalictri]TBL81310.1 rhomboid family intramembrane serine protease [Paenibacillus thalictri]